MGRLLQRDQCKTCSTGWRARQTRRASSRRSSAALKITNASALAEFFLILLLLLAQRHQCRVRQQRQGDVAIPSLIVAHLVVIQPALTLGGLEANLSISQRRPATAASRASWLRWRSAYTT